jgi:nitrite reductase/ring-hydroxylating ferredoxin subunit
MSEAAGAAPAPPPSWRALAGAPPPGTVLCRAEAIVDGGARVFTFGKGTARFEMFVLRRGETLVAFVNACPHAGLPLDLIPGHFYSRDQRHLLCANHGARFRVDDGFCVAGPCAGKSLVPVEVEVAGGDVVLGGG